jgi:hypothetical protein
MNDSNFVEKPGQLSERLEIEKEAIVSMNLVQVAVDLQTIEPPKAQNRC